MTILKNPTLLGVALATATIIGTVTNPQPASADGYTGTVNFQGNAVFVSPITGITLDDLTVSSGPIVEATGGGGAKCEITSNGSAPVDALGAYPQTGTLSVGLNLYKNGGGLPDGDCKVELRASGNDGGAISAHGSIIVVVTAAEISGNATVIAPDLPVRQSKTQAGLDTDCLKWVKKEIKLQGKCNAHLWKLGATEGVLKCKENDPEPADCDPVDYAEAVLALSFGDMNQQVDPPSASMVDLEIVGEEAKCQRYLGKAAVNFVAKRNILVQKKCIDQLIDTQTCRSQASTDAKPRLSLIDKCVALTPVLDVSGLTLPDVDEPCRADCLIGGTYDRKCLKLCFEIELTSLSDGLIGDLPMCGNSVIQGNETCDDGNTTAGDCCNATCLIEPPGTQTCGVGICEVTTDQCSNGSPAVCTPGDPQAEICDDGLDNDCDGLTDGADLDCP